MSRAAFPMNEVFRLPGGRILTKCHHILTVGEGVA